MSFRTILCATDFSSGSEQALRTAAMLARADDAPLVLAHAWTLPDLAFAAGGFTVPADVIQRIADDAETQLAMARVEASRLGVRRVKTVMLSGAVSDQLLGMLRADASIDLAVVGTHGESGLKRVLLGSIAEAIVRHAPCSVLVARARIEDRPFRSVLLPIDFSPEADRAAQVAADLTEPGGAGITLFHAIELPPSYMRDPLAIDTVSELDRRATRELEARADKLRRVARVPVTVKTAVGGAGAQILAAAEAATYDLIVVGSHGRTGISRALLGSVAEKVARHAWCPVLVARNSKE